MSSIEKSALEKMTSVGFDYGQAATNAYQVFMGRWEGVCKTFDPVGNYVESTPVHMNVYWISENVWHLHEHFENLYEVGETVYHTDITVEGKFCHGRAELVSLEGSMLTPFNFIFTIDSKVSNTTVYNNHYFFDPYTRRILTHKVRNGKTHCFQVQDFARVAI